MKLQLSAPAHVNIEISTACNLKCKMCKREKFDFGNKLMPFETFTAIMEKLPKGVEIISFGGYGEMTLHPRFFDMVKYAKEKGYRTETTSNGTLFSTDEKIHKLLESKLDTIRISVDHIREPLEENDAGHVFSSTLLQNLKRLNELRRETKKSMKLCINTVVHAGNIDELIELVKYFEDIGFDMVEFIRLDTTMNNAQQTLQIQKEKETYTTILKMNKRIKVITPLNRFAKWRKYYASNNTFCIFLHQCAHIRINGQVTPCAFGFAMHDFGNIHEQSLTQIWNNDEFLRIRKNPENPTCQNCKIFKWPANILPAKQ